MKIAVFWGGGEKKYVQKRPWLQLESSDFLQREFFWPRVGVKVRHQSTTTSQETLTHTRHNKTAQNTETSWIKRLQKTAITIQKEPEAKKKRKKQSENFAETTKIQKHRLQITAMTEIKSSYHNKATHSTSRGDNKGNVQINRREIMRNATWKGSVEQQQERTRLPSQTLMFTLLESTGSCDLQSKTCLVSWSPHANTYTPIRLEFDWDEYWA